VNHILRCSAGADIKKKHKAKAKNFFHTPYLEKPDRQEVPKSRSCRRRRREGQFGAKEAASAKRESIKFKYVFFLRLFSIDEYHRAAQL
jgi:hypothetical protein